MRSAFFQVLMLISTQPESQARMVNESERFVAMLEGVREHWRRVRRRRIGRSARVIRVQSRAMKAAGEISVVFERLQESCRFTQWEMNVAISHCTGELGSTCLLLTCWWLRIVRLLCLRPYVCPRGAPRPRLPIRLHRE